MNDLHRQILLEVGALPTAPFAEMAVHAYIRRFVASRRQLKLRADRCGNLMVSYAAGRRPRSGGSAGAGPLWLTAHTDHPGFVAERMTGPNRLLARWFGGVALPFFKHADVRFYVTPPDRPRLAATRSPDEVGTEGSASGQARVATTIPGRITRVITCRTNGEARPALRNRAESVYVEVPEPVPPGAVGMWDLPDPRIVGTQVRARAHDDLCQVAALLCLLDELDRRRPAGRVTCAFTRAEEVGFVGAIGLAHDKTLPANVTFISLEASDARAGGVNPGDGPILRVGDLATTFDQATLSWMNAVAKDLAAGSKGFRYQRRLMPGGTCESTALVVNGYTTGAMCLPLVNYHNMPAEGNRVASEIIDLRDFANELLWLKELVAQSSRRGEVNKTIARKLDRRFADHRSLLRTWMK